MPLKPHIRSEMTNSKVGQAPFVCLHWVSNLFFVLQMHWLIMGIVKMNYVIDVININPQKIVEYICI